jgi:hypothetical protein
VGDGERSTRVAAAVNQAILARDDDGFEVVSGSEDGEVVSGKAVARDLGGVEEAVREILLKSEPEVSRFNIYAGRNGAKEAVSVGGVWKIGDGAIALAGEEEAATFVERGASD